MLREHEPLTDGFYGTASILPPSWLAIGPNRRQQEALVASLALFGVEAMPCDSVEGAQRLSSGHLPVLCDIRVRALANGLLDAVSRRPSPILLIGVNGAQARAQMMLAGADDAVSARITPVELAARMKVAWRARAEALGVIRLAGMVFDTGLRQVRWQGMAIAMMPREFDLLLVLARHAGQVLSRTALLHHVWQTEFDPGTNSLEVHVFKLRGKLEALGGAVRIETIKGQGYRLVAERLAQG
jgi:DNA-binding response OmpR family regulator